MKMSSLYTRVKKFSMISVLVYSSLAVGLAIFLPTIPANAQAGLVCDGLNPNSTATNDCSKPLDTEPSVDSTLKTMLDLLSLVAGIIAVIMILIAGTKFMTSQGDAGKVTSARSTIIYAVIGLIIVVLAQTIIYFVVNSTKPAPQPPAQVNCPRGQLCPI